MINFRVNGEPVATEAEDNTPLLWVIRENLGLTGTKFGCGISLCGACTVHLNGQPIRSCITPVSAVAEMDVTTIEGVAAGGLHVIQQAWIEANVPQCGYCQSGQIMSAVALLEATPHPTDQEIDEAMSGNICRCGMYGRIKKAIHRAAELNSPASPESLDSSSEPNDIVKVYDPSNPYVRETLS